MFNHGPVLRSSTAEGGWTRIPQCGTDSNPRNTRTGFQDLFQPLAFRIQPFFIRPSTLNIQLSTVIMHPLANLAKLLHKQDFRDGLAASVLLTLNALLFIATQPVPAGMISSVRR